MKRKKLPAVGSTVYSVFGRPMRVVSHCLRPGHIEVKALDGSYGTAQWPAEWAILPGETFPLFPHLHH